MSFSHKPIVPCPRTSLYRHEQQGLIWICLCIFLFTLKDPVPIYWHYMTDRLQRFELKIFVCGLLKKQSHLYLGCPEGKQINITFSILGELSLSFSVLIFDHSHSAYSYKPVNVAWLVGSLGVVHSFHVYLACFIILMSDRGFHVNNPSCALGVITVRHLIYSDRLTQTP